MKRKGIREMAREDLMSAVDKAYTNRKKRKLEINPAPEGYRIGLYCRCGETAIHTFQTPGAYEECARLFSRLHAPGDPTHGNSKHQLLTEGEYNALKRAGAFAKKGTFTK